MAYSTAYPRLYKQSGQYKLIFRKENTRGWTRCGWNDLPLNIRTEFIKLLPNGLPPSLFPLPEWIDVEWRNGFLIQKRRVKLAKKGNYTIGNLTFKYLCEARQWADAQPAVKWESGSLEWSSVFTASWQNKSNVVNCIVQSWLIKKEG